MLFYLFLIQLAIDGKILLLQFVACVLICKQIKLSGVKAKLGASRLPLGPAACCLPLQHTVQLLVPLLRFWCLGLPPKFIPIVFFKSLRRCEPADLQLKSSEDVLILCNRGENAHGFYMTFMIMFVSHLKMNYKSLQLPWGRNAPQTIWEFLNAVS